MQKPLNVQCSLGSTAQLTCTFDGHPPPNCSWFREARRIYNDLNFEIENDSNSSQLTIIKVAQKLLGDYLCTIRNSYGEDLAMAVVTLKGIFFLN